MASTNIFDLLGDENEEPTSGAPAAKADAKKPAPAASKDKKEGEFQLLVGPEGLLSYPNRCCATCRARIARVPFLSVSLSALKLVVFSQPPSPPRPLGPHLRRAGVGAAVAAAAASPLASSRVRSSALRAPTAAAVDAARASAVAVAAVAVAMATSVLRAAVISTARAAMLAGEALHSHLALVPMW